MGWNADDAKAKRDFRDGVHDTTTGSNTYRSTYDSLSAQKRLNDALKGNGDGAVNSSSSTRPADYSPGFDRLLLLAIISVCVGYKYGSETGWLVFLGIALLLGFISGYGRKKTNDKVKTNSYELSIARNKKWKKSKLYKALYLIVILFGILLTIGLLIVNKII